ncbi:cytochrome P450 [Stachybotrys elegans]|uniref:Cytochrome P450 n=1 Tax=Stachybotrys elegans TaxID=80388 RepID=A0A8K0WT28_9HYPO|nr:cytochrome P450 [Stachybotrys elegans]
MDSALEIPWLPRLKANYIQLSGFEWPELSVGLVLRAFVTLALVWSVLGLLYNLYLHPLAKFPGPFLARSSLLWRFWHSMGGHFHRVLDDAHHKYGDVVRVSPNELSFGSAGAFKDIYGNKPPGEPKVIKNEFYDMFGAGFSEPCLASERDPRKAGQKRGLFAHAFSAKGLMEQEEIMQRCIDQFILKLGKTGTKPEGVNLVKWLEMVAFDILGEMAFGESFHCLENESSHFWLDVIFGHVFIVALMDNLRRYPLLLAAVKLLPSRLTNGLSKKQAQQTQLSKLKARTRLEKVEDQRDFMSNACQKVRDGQVSEEEFAAHSSSLVIAGGETTATAMGALVYNVLKNDHVYAKLKQELRTRYKNLEEIDVVSTSQLPYLQAAIKESLRMFSTNAQGLGRKSPGIEVDGHYVPEGAEIYVSPWTPAHHERYWNEPYVYNPDRWLDPNCQDYKAASQPFSVGPRACIGKHFAYAQMSLQLAKLVWMYDMELVRKDMDFEKEARMYFFWQKPKLEVRFHSPQI